MILLIYKLIDVFLKLAHHCIFCFLWFLFALLSLSSYYWFRVFIWFPPLFSLKELSSYENNQSTVMKPWIYDLKFTPILLRMMIFLICLGFAKPSHTWKYSYGFEFPNAFTLNKFVMLINGKIWIGSHACFFHAPFSSGNVSHHFIMQNAMNKKSLVMDVFPGSLHTRNWNLRTVLKGKQRALQYFFFLFRKTHRS